MLASWLSRFDFGLHYGTEFRGDCIVLVVWGFGVWVWVWVFVLVVLVVGYMLSAGPEFDCIFTDISESTVMSCASTYNLKRKLGCAAWCGVC